MKSGGTLKDCNFGEPPACPADATGADAADTGSPANPYSNYLQQQVQTNNAVDAGFNTLQNHMDNGGKASGGILRGALMAATQVSDPGASLGILGVGGGLALLTKAGEAGKERKEVERLEKERLAEEQRRANLEAERERERQRAITVEKQKIRTDRLNLVNDQFNHILPASVSEQPPAFSMNPATKEIYYLSFGKERNQSDVFKSLTVWLAYAPVIIYRNSDNTWPFTTDIKRKVTRKLHDEKRTEIDLQLLGPFLNKSEALRVRDDIVTRIKTLDAINLLRFFTDPLTFGIGKEGTTDFWDTQKPVTKAGQPSKSVPATKSFWDN